MVSAGGEWTKACVQNRASVTAAVQSGALAMAKGQQRSNKEAKKPKKDAASSSKPVSPTTVMPTITTTIIERGKKKGK
jgi:Flp pilus assembly protein TadG